MKRVVSRKILILISILVSVIIMALSGIYIYSRHIARYAGISLGNETAISEDLRGIMMRRSWRMRIDFSAYSDDREAVEDIVSQLYEDALYESSDPGGGDYLRFQCGGYRLDYSVNKGLMKYDYNLKIIPDYYTTAEQEMLVDEMVEDIIRDSGLDASSSDYDRIRFVHDYICDNVAYDTVHKHTPGSEHIQSTAYGALYYRTALCQGYAVLSYRLLKELGIDNRIVTGYASVSDIPEKHAWNIVCLDGQYYNMDVTLDAVRASDEYFLKSDKSFESDHDRDDIYKTDTFETVYIMSKDDY